MSSLALQNIRCIHTNLDSDSDTIKEEFSTFLMDLVGIIQDKQEKEETGIVGGAKWLCKPHSQTNGMGMSIRHFSCVKRNNKYNNYSYEYNLNLYISLKNKFYNQVK